MSYLLVVRIVPPAAIAGADFTNYLTTALGDLRITAYDLSYANVDNPPPAGPGTQVGTVATYVAPTNPPNPIGQTNATMGYTPPTYPAGLTAGIVQYWDLYSYTNISGTFFYYVQAAVATAVIELNPPTNIENLRLVVQWGTGAGAQPIPVVSDLYQLKLLTPPAGWQDPNTWPTLPAHAYIELPKPPPAASPYSVTIPEDGSPPPFDALLTAVKAALNVDPGGAPNLGTLTIDQCRNIAYEIIWAQQPPLPVPPDPIDQLYTNPPNVGTMLQGSGSSTPNQLEGDRQQFEGNLNKYYSTADTDADRLTSYVVALSRAVACEQRSVAATQAQLQFPTNPVDPSSDDATVTLTGITAFTTFATPKSFGVPAAYFYALAAAMPSEMTAQQRYQLATGEKTERILAAFTAAINTRTVTDAEAYTTIAGLSCNAAQAARRLAVLRPTPAAAAFAPLGSTATVPVAYPAPLRGILQAWLDYPPTPAAGASSDSYQPSDDATAFWPAQATANPDQNGFLNVVLCALTQGYVIPTPPNPLGFQICTSLGVNSVGQLAAVTTQQWQTLFEDNPTWLPPFTQPGNTDARIATFIRYFERFFASNSSLALQSVDLALSVAVNAGTTLTFVDTTGVISGMSAINVHYIPPGTTVSGAPTPTQVQLAIPPGTSLTLPIPQYTNITFAPAISSAGTTSTLPLLPLPNGDPITACLAAYGGFVFGAGFNTAQLQTAAATVFAGDPTAQAWLVKACQTIDALYAVVNPPAPGVPVVFPAPLSSPPPNPANLFFSCAEALYARGFTSAADILQLSAADFAQAVVGTIAFDVAAQIYANAGTYSGGGYTSGGPFQPINPDGTLTDCIPPECLSPLGPIAYLNELLQLSESSTCDQPLQPGAKKTLGSVVSARRGPIGNLTASCANLDIELPVVDLVNECLELMGSVAAPGAGAVYDTSADTLAGYKLCEEDCCSSDRDDPGCHLPEKIYAALPEYSTPGAPVAANSAVEPAVYDTLKDDFSTCCLPYSQALDVARTYLRHFRSCRFEEMRAFRKCITEFVLDPAGEPSGFQTHLWRYPVRLDIAIEYLGISLEEYSELFQGSAIPPCGAPTDRRTIKSKPVAVQTLYGSPRPVAKARAEGVMGLPQFLEANCLDYCEFLELWHSGYVPFTNGQDPKQGLFPDCEPCCLDDYWLVFPGDSGSDVGLLKLAIFVRLWRKLRAVCGAQYTLAQLRDICDVLQLFNGATPNPDFIRQLASFQILRDRFGLPLSDRRDPPTGGAVDAARSHLLALWVGPTAAKWQWAVGELLERGLRRGPEFLKILATNLDGLSALAGFDPTSATDNWHALPTHTLRFAEVLSKLHASPFSIEEIFFLFTVQPHLDGDDPFELQEDNESLDLPLGLPDDDERDGLWRLREKLLEARPEEPESDWHWRGVERFLTEELGFAASDVLSLGQRFFPEVLEHAGHAIPPGARRFTTALASAATVPAMWNGSPEGAFRYDSTAQQLWTEIPLADKAVIDRLMRVRALNVNEQGAVQDLRFQPRVQLCRFALLFADFEAAQRHLIEEHDEHRRWDYFRRQVALCHARCAVIAEHLAHHVARATNTEVGEGAHTAKLILRHLFADENLATTTWENPNGTTPSVTWSTPAGGGFAALLGLLGTGLMTEFTAEGAGAVWRDIAGNLAVFGAENNRENCPVPTVLPALNLTLTPEQMQFISVRNGFGLRDATGAWLGGAQGFQTRWSGALLVESEGSYEFLARQAREHDHDAHHDHHHHEHHEHHGRHRWRVTLKRGQRTWVLLAHRWPGESDRPSSRLPLRRGAYELCMEYVQPSPAFADEDEVRRMQSGIDLLYSGPDTRDEVSVIPRERLFCISKDATLGAGLTPASPAATQYLQQRYFSSLRDIRRTYQRAFKSLLFAHRLALGSVSREHPQSELGYMLQQPANFAGLAYYRSGGAFATHAAGFDFNLLPLLDSYHPPAGDARANPSPQRMQALFDWWERLYDYTRVRVAVHKNCGRAVWPLFLEALQLQSAGPGNDPQPLLRHICADSRHWAADLHYFQNQFSPVYAVTTADLEDDRWLVRAWHADQWLRALDECFCGKDITRARPDLWASDDPSAVLPGETVTGNANLTQYLDDGLLDNGDPRRYGDLRRLNDGLRERGRAALVSYLCANNRVALPWLPGAFAHRPRDLSDLLLIDVESGICQTVSRIDNAISAVQTFIQRARLGLEPGWTVSSAFSRLWDRQFATFCVWRDCKRRHFYKENFIECVELDRARRVESFRLLQSQLHNHVLTAARPAGLAWWPDERPPAHPTAVTLQENTPAALTLLSAPLSPREGIDLMATPDWGGRQNWLSAVETIASTGTQTPAGAVAPPPPAPVTAEPIPYWMEAAIKMGTTFLRIAAAGYPLGANELVPHRQQGAEDCVECCRECGCVHPERVDEYYFWLVGGEEYVPPEVPTQLAGAITEADNYQYGYQDNFYNQNQQQAAYWHDETQRPQLLKWKPVPIVRLAWCRVHNGRFLPVRQSTHGIQMDPSTSLDLSFYGRTDDSLVFAVYQPATPTPIPGYEDTSSAPGFRYDLATDEAVLLPLVGPATTSTGYAGNLPAYPYFVYDEPGSHLFPLGPYSPALAIACFLRLNCQYEAALKWYALAFDPLQSDNTWIDCHGNDTTTPTGAGTPVLEIARVGATDTGRHVRNPIPGEACCDSTDITCAQARDRSVTLDYLEALRDWGDAVMRRNTREAYEQARTIYDTARWILGKSPRKIKLAEPEHPPQVSNFVPSFPPLNPRLMAIYEVTNDRLAMIHRCLTSSRFRNGTGRCEEPRFCLDQGPKSRDCGQECGESCGDEALWCHLPSPYRFQVLVGKALELASACRALGADLLATFEKADAAYLEELRARQEREMAGLAIEVRKDAWRDSDWQVEVLQKSKSVAQANLQYYKQQIENGLITPELAYQDLTIAGTVLRAAGNIVEAVGGGMSAAGNYYDGAAGFGGSPLIYAQLPPGSPLAGLFAAIARIMTALADVASSTGSLELTEGGWQRRADEWLHQTQVLAIEIEQIETQILAAQRRRDQALRELNNQERQREHAAEIQDFLRDRFTSQDLYLHLQKETAALYRRSYDLAFDMARRAERAFNFELGHTDRHFLPAECWDNLHAGLTAGQRLETAVRGMEKAYLDENLREYELTKHFSLRLHFPLEFLKLKATGSCEVQIPEWMFDLDYPGMYMRRIKNVSLTLPCVTGPYTGVHCRLTLLSSRTRIDPRLSPPAHRCCSDRRRCSEYEACADDPRVVREYAAREAIATSTGQADTGMFEVNFRDERYLPFEYFGAVSCWRIELPRENNYFDLDTLSDVILHMNYTAREGGEPLRRAANADAHRHVPGDGWVIFDMRRDLAVEWERFRAQRREGEERVFEMQLQRDMLPFIPGRRELRVEETALVFYSAQEGHKECDPSAQCPCPEPKRHDCYEVEITAHGHRRDRGHHDKQDHRKGYLRCRATDELQHLYSGRLRECLGEVGGEHPGLHIKLEFECDVGHLQHAYLLFRYSVPAFPERCDEPCRRMTGG